MQTVTTEQLLEELARARESGPDVATISLNLVAFVERDSALLAALTDRIEALAHKHAMRSIVISGFRAAGEHEIHDERIRLGAATLGAAEIRSLVHDLLAPNLRTALVWAGDRLDDPRLRAVAQLADTVVLLGERPANLAWLRELLPLNAGELGSKLRDLAYLRLLAWQDLVAQFFDDPELAAELESISRIEIAAGSDPEAYYLVGWLASRLQWEPCGPDEFCNGRGAPIRIVFERDGSPRRIRRVRLHSAQSTFGATVHEESDDIVCLTVGGAKTRPQRCLPLHVVDLCSLIERALFEPEAPGVYEQTLAMVARLLEHTP